MRAAAFFVAWLAATAFAAAAEPETRRAGIGRKNGQLVVSVGLRDVISHADAQRLTSGFATRVLIRVALVRAGARPEQVAIASRFSEIVYDLWDEKFHVRRTDTGAQPLVLEVGTADEAIRHATSVVGFPVASLFRIDAGATYFLKLQADLNPLSEQRVAEVRKWLSRPAAQGRLAPGDSFFGSFVSFFVNPRVEESERRLRVVSQKFTVPP